MSSASEENGKTDFNKDEIDFSDVSLSNEMSSGSDYSFKVDKERRDESNLSSERLLYKKLPQPNITHETKGALYRNIISHNVDGAAQHRVKFTFSPVQMETPVSILLNEYDSGEDVYVSTDDEDFVEGSGENKIIPVEEFVLKSWINP